MRTDLSIQPVNLAADALERVVVVRQQVGQAGEGRVDLDAAPVPAAAADVVSP